MKKYLALILVLILCLTAVMARAESEETPTAEATQEPEPTATPEPSATPEATAEPEATATPEATAEPEASTSPEATPEASTTPEASATPEPIPAADLPTPGSVTEGAIDIRLEGAQQMDGVWTAMLSAPDASLSFSWTANVENTGFVVYVDSTLVSDNIIQATSLSLAAANYTGQHVLYVGAVQQDGTAVWGSLNFQIAAGGGGFPGGFSGGGLPSGGGGMGDMAEQEQGFHVTPGTALTDTHAGGNKTLTAFAAADIADTGEAVSAITQYDSGETLTLDDGATFTVQTEGTTLTLQPEAEGEGWRMSLLMLEGLERSGIDTLCLNFADGSSTTIDTALELSGTIWGQLRSAGYVGKDCVLTVCADGITAEIDGTAYLLNADGTLGAAS